MLNRNAEALFWIGRYMERAENHARLIDVHYHLQVDDEMVSIEGKLNAEASEPSYSKWVRIVDALGSREAYEQQYGSYNERDVLFIRRLIGIMRTRLSPVSVMPAATSARFARRCQVRCGTRQMVFICG